MSICADIVIVNWNSGDLLRQCIASTSEFDDGVGKVIVIDNGSCDGSATMAQLPSNVEIMATGQNLGFSKGCNLGARLCTAPYILFLNPDARLLGGGLANALAFMESEAGQDYGVCGVQLVGEDGEVQKPCTIFPTPAVYLGQATGLSRLLPKAFPPQFMLDFDHRSSRAVDVVIGAYYLVRRDLFEKLGGFDERFFVYFDEVDFALRARNVGWGTYYLAEARGYHKGCGTSDQVKAHRLFYVLRSRLLFAFKHFDGPRAWSIAGITFLIESTGRVTQALVGRRSWSEARDVLRGYAMLLRDLPGIARTVRNLRIQDRLERR